MKVRTVHRLYSDYEKEELWLNAMSAKGLALIHYSWGTYRFEQSALGEWTYRIELLPKHPRKPESKNYLRFMAETGAQPVATYWRWVYFRKLTTDKPFEVFSDRDSRIAHYRRILTLYVSLFSVLILDIAANMIIATHGAPGLALALPLLAMLSAMTVLVATLGIRLFRKVRALKVQKQLFE